MFVNNFLVRLTAELKIDEQHELPLDSLDDEKIRAHGLRVSISEELNPGPLDVEIVQYVDGQLLRGLEGTIIRDWPAGALCYCSLTAEQANRIYTPAVSYTDKKFPIRGHLIAEPAVAAHVYLGATPAGLIFASTKIQSTQQIEVSVSIDNGVSFGRALISQPGEEFVGHAVIRDAPDASLVLVTRYPSGPGLIMYTHDLRRLTTARHFFDGIPSDAMLTSMDYSREISIIAGTDCYFFDTDAGVTLLGSTEITGDWDADTNPLRLPQQNNLGSPLFIDSSGAAWSGSFNWSASDPGFRRAEIYPFWGQPEGVAAARIVLPSSSMYYLVSPSGLLIDNASRQIQVPVSGSVVGLAYDSQQSMIYVGDSSGLIHPVRFSWPDFELLDPFSAEHEPHAMIATSLGLIYAGREIGGDAELYIAPYGGSASGVFTDGYMPGDTLRNILSDIQEIFERLDQLGIPEP